MCTAIQVIGWLKQFNGARDRAGQRVPCRKVRNREKKKKALNDQHKTIVKPTDRQYTMKKKSKRYQIKHCKKWTLPEVETM